MGYAGNYIEIINCSNAGKVGASDGDYAGGIVGYAGDYIEITNCFNTGEVETRGGNYAGGIAGYATNRVYITACYNTGDISSVRNGYGGSYAGGIVGHAGDSIYLIDSYNTGEVSGRSYIGGVVGSVYGYAEISNCNNIGFISGGIGASVGGIAGCASGDSNYPRINNCYNSGSVRGSDNVGGIAGEIGRYMDDYGTITNSYNTGSISGSTQVGGIAGCGYQATITGCYNEGAVVGDEYVGGVLGFADNFSDITDCYNVGDVTGDSTVGGIMGQNEYVCVYRCYNIGTINGSKFIGGVSGYNGGGSYTYRTYFYNCYNIGSVSGDSFIGGIFGGSTDRYYTYSNCYYGGNCTLTVANGGNGSAGARDENLIANAKSLNWYLDTSLWRAGYYAWDFENVWTFVEGMNDGYPVLRGFSTKITYNSNSQPEEVVSESFSVGETIVLAEADLFVREGYSVSSWNAMADGSGASYAPGATYTGSSVTLYAQWGRMTYAVTFNANDGSGTMSSVEKIYNEDLVLPANEFTKTGYDFKGWATSANGSVVYGDGAKYTTNASATLYAVWEAKVIAVNLNRNGGAGGTSAIYLKYDSGWYSSSSCTSSSKITALPSTPTRTGYEFKGYSTEPDGSGTLAVSATGAINVSDTFYSTDGTRTWYAVWEARNPAYYDSEGGFWYVENGKLPQSKVGESLKATLEGQWSSLTDGSVYYMGVEELSNSEFASDGGMQSKVYNGEEYVKFNGEYYLVEPIRWRLVYSSSQKEGYAVENTSVLATMAEIVFVGSYSSTKIGVGAGYSAESVTMLLKNQVSTEFLVSESREVEIFRAPKDTTTVSGSVFVASSEELANFTTSKNNTTGSGVKAGKVSLSDFVKDYLRATGQGDYYFTRDLGDQLNTIRCLNPVGDRSQAKAKQTLGVQFTIKVTEYACISA